ncbi:hypothetical protein [Klebsiella oxytoca]|uniref:hypothetical protein n=1 Tax=Klebsiella oxytoca TaxID=571 RepID=UPI00398249AA
MTINLSNWTDEELKKYHKSLIDDQVKSLNDKGTAVGLLFFYGFIAFGGGVGWCIDEVLSRLAVPVQGLFCFFIISGALSLYFSFKKDRDSISRKAFIIKELERVQGEVLRRSFQDKNK